MAIVTKTISGKEYAYFTKREGKKVVTKYIGPMHSPKVQKMIAEYKGMRSVPEKLRMLFWDTEMENIHLKRNARYVIERVLELGNLDSINWLQRIYTVQRILDVLDTSRVVSEKSRRFWRLWFGVENA